MPAQHLLVFTLYVFVIHHKFSVALIDLML